MRSSPPSGISEFLQLEESEREQIVEEEEEERMSGIWKTLREKLRFTKSSSTGCCGALWGSNGNGDDVIEEIAATESTGEMNLALAEERQMPAVEMERNSLMNWLEEEEEEEVKREAVGIEESCCVCMEKKKGAAFIPCGHAFCRGCARDLWIERRSCPLCNRRILEILHIY